MGSPVYLLILLGLGSVSFILQKRNSLQLFRNRNHFFMYVLTILAVGLIWDYFSVWLGIWSFPNNGTIGIKIGVLPIEEYLFFLIGPYFGLTIYKAFEKQLSDA